MQKDKGTVAAGNTCETAVAHGVDVTIVKRRQGNKQPMTPQEQEVPTKLKAALTQACNDDKWSKDVIDCFTTAEDIATCKAKLTTEQRAAYTRAAMGVMMAGGGGGGGMPPHGMGMGGNGMGGNGGMGGGAGGQAGGSDGSGPPMAAGGLPQSCRDYAETVDKIEINAACKAVPAATKDTLKKQYDAMAAGWADAAKMPDQAKQGMADGCTAALAAAKTAVKDVAGCL